MDGDKPIFQFTGDEDFGDSDEEQNGVTEEEGASRMKRKKMTL